jgi:murein L,D-transpeptidase YcbB/YkuD
MRIRQIIFTACIMLSAYPTAYAQNTNPEIRIFNVSGHRIENTKTLNEFYNQRAGDTLWVRNSKLSSEAREIIENIAESWKHGLNPDNYNISILNELAQGKMPQLSDIEIDILMSDSVIQYAQDISGMRLSPQEWEEDKRSWSGGIQAQSLMSILANERNKAGFLNQLLPQDNEYKKLSLELQNLVEDLSKKPDVAERVAKYPGLIRPGSKNQAILAIRAKLGVSVSPGGQSDVYDEKLQKAVMEFQIRHGLTPDGLIGQRSFNALYQTRTQKLVKLIANLERRRWVHRPLPSTYIEVNVPKMKLKAIENNRTTFEMPVVVGRAKRPTTSFIDDIIGIRFNPLWYVPDTIKKEDFLPSLQKDPLSLNKKGIQFRVKTEEGFKKVEPTEIDWQTINEDNLKDIQMFQDSGDDNALGVIRVLMPNQYDIYLHDTNDPALFAKDDRALSSGCVRVAEPRKIANFILAKNAGWNEERLESILAKQKLYEVKSDTPMPVYIVYFTAWTDDNGEVIIGNDVYGWDTALVQALVKKGKIPFDLLGF